MHESSDARGSQLGWKQMAQLSEGGGDEMRGASFVFSNDFEGRDFVDSTELCWREPTADLDGLASGMVVRFDSTLLSGASVTLRGCEDLKVMGSPLSQTMNSKGI